MKIILSSKYAYGWVEFEAGIITKTCQIYASWSGRSVVALITTLEDKKCPLVIETEKNGRLSVEVFYNLYAQEFLPKEAVDGSK